MESSTGFAGCLDGDVSYSWGRQKGICYARNSSRRHQKGHPMSFKALAREHGNITVHFLSEHEKRELVGTYLVQEYGEPNQFEPLVESITPQHMTKLYQAMADGDSKAQAEWTYETAGMIANAYSGLTQVEVEKANWPPFWADEDEDKHPKGMGQSFEVW